MRAEDEDEPEWVVAERERGETEAERRARLKKTRRMELMEKEEILEERERLEINRMCMIVEDKLRLVVHGVYTEYTRSIHGVYCCDFLLLAVACYCLLLLAVAPSGLLLVPRRSLHT